MTGLSYSEVGLPDVEGDKNGRMAGIHVDGSAMADIVFKQATIWTSRRFSYYRPYHSSEIQVLEKHNRDCFILEKICIHTQSTSTYVLCNLP